MPPLRRGLVAAFLAVVLAAGPGAAQTGPSVVVVDQERLFEESLLGQAIEAEIQRRSAALAAENRRIEGELIDEERDLTERRPDLDPTEFRALADAFNERVDRLREEQDAKTRELVAFRDAERQRFTQTVGPILLDYMRQSGAGVMLDRRSTVATADRVDVTDEVIEAIDARLQDAPPSPPSGDVVPDPPSPPAAGEAGQGRDTFLPAQPGAEPPDDASGD